MSESVQKENSLRIHFITSRAPALTALGTGQRLGPGAHFALFLEQTTEILTLQYQTVMCPSVPNPARMGQEGSSLPARRACRQAAGGWAGRLPSCTMAAQCWACRPYGASWSCGMCLAASQQSSPRPWRSNSVPVLPAAMGCSFNYLHLEDKIQLTATYVNVTGSFWMASPVFWGCYLSIAKLTAEMNPDNTSSRLWSEEAVVQRQTGAFLPSQRRFHSAGPFLQKCQQLGKPSENPGKVGKANTVAAKRPTSWRKKVICFDWAFLMCTWNGVTLLVSQTSSAPLCC